MVGISSVLTLMAMLTTLIDTVDDPRGLHRFTHDLLCGDPSSFPPSGDGGSAWLGLEGEASEATSSLKVTCRLRGVVVFLTSVGGASGPDSVTAVSVPGMTCDSLAGSVPGTSGVSVAVSVPGI